MYFKVSLRNNPATQSSCGYYRLVESYRNEYNRICHRTLLNIGFIESDVKAQLPHVQKRLSDLVAGKQTLFEEKDPIVRHCVTKWWQELIDKKRIDVLTPERAKSLIQVDTIKHKNVREVGAEWLGFQALQQLGISNFLQSEGWDEESIQLAHTQIVSRAVYPFSENRTSRWIQENSAICEVTGYPLDKMTKDKLYESALKLYSVKDKLESYLSNKTNELFDLQDRIILYDLTNTYFEGQKNNSKIAKRARSKEKRNDAKLVVLAMVINPEGFIKYSNIFEGNMADSSSLIEIINNLRLQTSHSALKATVVIDAGIATEDNLALLVNKGYNYLCVARSKPKEYEIVGNKSPDTVTTKGEYKLTLQEVKSQKHNGYFLKVNSPAKRLKEASMKSVFETRFEEKLINIQQSIYKKHGVKKIDKVNQRIGRAIEKYPSVAKYYSINVEADKETENVISVKWQKDKLKDEQAENSLGEYFLRTNIPIDDTAKIWDTYNCIREIESSFRCLKTDLDLRPIYHKNDNATMAHLHLALLGYWLVNTVRYQLKAKGIKHNWTEIVRIANTQKILTTYGQNALNEPVSFRRCTEANENLEKLYQYLGYKSQPFTKRKSVVHNSELKKNETLHYGQSPPG